MLQLCEKAANCELRDGQFGKELAFKPDFEPGSAKYARRFGKRKDDGPWPRIITLMELGRKKINFGTYEPYDALGAVQESDVCNSISCNDEGLTLTTGLITGKV